MNTLYQVGLLNTGATIAARLLGDWGPNAWVTNEPMPAGLFRWWELRVNGTLWPRQAVNEGLTVFPYGQPVDPP